MHYFRPPRRTPGVGRHHGGYLAVLNDAPGFSQRFTHTLSDDDNAINGQAELSRDDDATGEHDLAITTRKIG